MVTMRSLAVCLSCLCRSAATRECPCVLHDRRETFYCDGVTPIMGGTGGDTVTVQAIDVTGKVQASAVNAAVSYSLSVDPTKITGVDKTVTINYLFNGGTPADRSVQGVDSAASRTQTIDIAMSAVNTGTSTVIQSTIRGNVTYNDGITKLAAPDSVHRSCRRWPG